MTTTGPDENTRRDEAALALFFAAARLDEPAPSRALLSAILADAGEATAARAAEAPHRIATPAAAAAAQVRAPRRGFFAAFGGWRVATALAAASAFGFWIGLNGTVDVSSSVGWTTTSTVTADGDPVTEFFDIASAE